MTKEERRQYDRNWRANNREKTIGYSRKYYYKNRRKVVKRIFEAVKKWRKENPLKVTAHRKVFVELRAGRIKKTPCPICGSSKVESHHKDYTKPLKIIWLCKKHHAEADKKLRLILTKKVAVKQLSW